jgi:hypothetical protein
MAKLNPIIDMIFRSNKIFHVNIFTFRFYLTHGSMINGIKNQDALENSIKYIKKVLETIENGTVNSYIGLS